MTTDTELLSWLLRVLERADQSMLEICYDFNLHAEYAEEKGANDALDAMRMEFGFDLYNVSRETIESAMKADIGLHR